MRIAQVTRQFYPSIGGIEAVVHHLSHHLLAAGHQVKVVALDRIFEGDGTRLAPHEIVQGIPVERLPFRGPRQYALAPGVINRIRDCDLVHLHSSDFFLDYLAWTQIVHRVPLVLSSHGLFFHTRVARIWKQLYLHTETRLALRQVSQVTCDSTPDLELLGHVAPARKLNLIPNGIDYEQLGRFAVTDRDPDLIITVGRLASNKRLDRMLKAFAHLLAQRPAARLAIIGPDWGCLPALQQLCRELQIVEQVALTGAVTESVLLGWLQKASVWLSSSAYESFGIALLEAMAAGCVPVVQPLPAWSQVLTGGVEGFVADFDYPEQGASAIQQALDLGASERQEMVSRARLRASPYSWAVVAQQFEHVYEKAIEH